MIYNSVIVQYDKKENDAGKGIDFNGVIMEQSYGRWEDGEVIVMGDVPQLLWVLAKV